MDRQEFERLRQSVQSTLPQQHARTREDSLAAIRRAQAIMMDLVPRDRSLVEEWLQEKPKRIPKSRNGVDVGSRR